MSDHFDSTGPMLSIYDYTEHFYMYTIFDIHHGDLINRLLQSIPERTNKIPPRHMHTHAGSENITGRKATNASDASLLHRTAMIGMHDQAFVIPTQSDPSGSSQVSLNSLSRPYSSNCMQLLSRSRFSHSS